MIGPGNGPAWSPDGQKIVFTDAKRNQDIYVMNTDGSGVTRITNNPCEVSDSSPSWSPDGTKIAFARHEIDSCSVEEPTDLGTHTYVMNPDGSGQTSLGVGGGHPDWSPDGRMIAFAGGSIWVVNSDGSGARALPGIVGHPDNDPVWSPDGRKIAFDREVDFTCCPGSSSRHIMVMNADGTGQTQITHRDDPESASVKIGPSWQPLPTASYEHPQSAASLSASLVPTFRPCGTGASPTNGQHSPPLGVQSCLPPVPGSNVARVGSSSVGTASFSVVPGDTDPTNGDQADVTLSASLSDVKTTGGADYAPNPSGPDLTEITRLRFTDKANNYGGASGTATEYDFRVPIECAATSDPSIGSSCSANTSADSMLPGFVTEQRQTVIQAFRVRVDDAGANGTTGDSDDRIFATQGIYIP
jgi:hypothetical protein